MKELEGLIDAVAQAIADRVKAHLKGTPEKTITAAPNQFDPVAPEEETVAIEKPKVVNPKVEGETSPHPALALEVTHALANAYVGAVRAKGIFKEGVNTDQLTQDLISTIGQIVGANHEKYIDIQGPGQWALNATECNAFFGTCATQLELTLNRYAHLCNT